MMRTARTSLAKRSSRRSCKFTDWRKSVWGGSGRNWLGFHEFAWVVFVGFVGLVCWYIGVCLFFVGCFLLIVVFLFFFGLFFFGGVLYFVGLHNYFLFQSGRPSCWCLCYLFAVSFYFWLLLLLLLVVVVASASVCWFKDL